MVGVAADAVGRKHTRGPLDAGQRQHIVVQQRVSPLHREPTATERHYLGRRRGHGYKLWSRRSRGHWPGVQTSARSAPPAARADIVALMPRTDAVIAALRGGLVELVRPGEGNLSGHSMVRFGQILLPVVIVLTN